MSERKQQQIQRFISSLNAIFERVEDYDFAYVEPSVYSRLSIKCSELRLTSKDAYESPPQP